MFYPKKVLVISVIIISNISWAMEDKVIPTDPHYGRQWGLHSGAGGLNMEKVWAISKGHSLIGTVDNHIDISNMGFDNPNYSNLLANPNLLKNYSPRVSGIIKNGDSSSVWLSPEDSTANHEGHSAHILGILSAPIDGEGTVGACPTCSIGLVYRDGHLKELGIEHLIRSGAQVINISGPVHGARDEYLDQNLCESSQNSQTHSACRVLDLAESRDVMIVAAAGNSYDGLPVSEGIQFPASDPRTVAVGSVDKNGSRSSWSIYDKNKNRIDLMASGGGVISTFDPGDEWNVIAQYKCGDIVDEYNSLNDDPKDGVGACTGTSMSTPFIAGLAGLLRSLDPLLTTEEH